SGSANSDASAAPTSFHTLMRDLAHPQTGGWLPMAGKDRVQASLTWIIVPAGTAWEHAGNPPFPPEVIHEAEPHAAGPGSCARGCRAGTRLRPGRPARPCRGPGRG